MFIHYLGERKRGAPGLEKKHERTGIIFAPMRPAKSDSTCPEREKALFQQLGDGSAPATMVGCAYAFPGRHQFRALVPSPVLPVIHHSFEYILAVSYLP